MKRSNIVLAFLALLFGLTTSSQAQVVSGQFVPATSLSVPTIATAPVSSSPFLGTIPMRRGLFGWRTENVPVFAGPSVVMAAPQAVPVPTFQAARPVITSVPMMGSTFSSFNSGAFAFPVSPATATVPNAVIQSNFRGATPIYSSGFAPALVPAAPVFGVPVNTFFPGAVMTMQ